MNKIYKYEMHCHTGEFGWCAKVPAKTLVEEYAKAGYQGICISNHYIDFGFQYMPEISWHAKIKRYLKGYHAAVKTAENYDMDIILALELRFKSNVYNDYLVFGMDEEFLYRYPKLYSYSPEDFKCLCEDQGLMIFQAHPYRYPCEPISPFLLDGLEVFNGNPRQENNNHLSLALQKKTGLLPISGSDYHQLQDLATGGCVFDRRIRNGKELVELFDKQKKEPLKALYQVIQNSGQINRRP